MYCLLHLGHMLDVNEGKFMNITVSGQIMVGFSVKSITAKNSKGFALLINHSSHNFPC